MAAKRVSLRRPDVCAICGGGLAAGDLAWWDSATRTVTCAPCVDANADNATPTVSDGPAAVDIDRPGATLGRGYERRRVNRERRVREAHPHIGGLLLAWNEEPQHQAAFRHGEQGEIAVAASVEKAAATVDGRVIHNRRMPGGRGDIDHIAIVPSGIFVIDTKAVTGQVEVRSRWFKPPLLFIGGRDRTKYLDGLDRQLQAVRDAIVNAGLEAPPILGALCFTKADLPLLRTVEMRGHLLTYRKPLGKRLTVTGPITAGQRDLLAARLDAALPPA